MDTYYVAFFSIYVGTLDKDFAAFFCVDTFDTDYPAIFFFFTITIYIVSIGKNIFNLSKAHILLRNDDLLVHTHYHNSNLIWRTVSRRVDEVIPSDHPRRVASRVIQWYDLIHEK